MTNIYVLSLENSKYYVGKTDNLNFRLNNHFNQNGSFWTIKYKPINVKKIIPNCDPYDEDKYTIIMMTKYGINNVRGGTFSRITLSNEEICIIIKMINNANDNCFNCFSKSHFCMNCPYQKINDNRFIALKYKIINNCQKYDIQISGKISINELVNSLISSDEKIFNGITTSNVYGMCKLINKSKIKGVNFIDYKLNRPIDINYRNFANGIVAILNSEINK